MTFMDDIYNSVANPPRNLTETEVVEYFPTITVEDRSRGYIERYFSRPTVHSTGYITEISHTDYERLRLNTLFYVVKILWRVAGPIDDAVRTMPGIGEVRTLPGAKTANLIAVAEGDKQLPDLKLKLRNPLQFYKLG